MRLKFFAVAAMLMLTSRGAEAQQANPYYTEAERQYLSLEVNTRLLFQIALTSNGYWPAVPNVQYSRRLHEATRQFQIDRGEAGTGVLTKTQVEQILSVGTSVLKD